MLDRETASRTDFLTRGGGILRAKLKTHHKQVRGVGKQMSMYCTFQSSSVRMVRTSISVQLCCHSSRIHTLYLSAVLILVKHVAAVCDHDDTWEIQTIERRQLMRTTSYILSQHARAKRRIIAFLYPVASRFWRYRQTSTTS